ncbi:ABC-2 family transporter protein [Bifidobacterium pseudolongum subsp. globosum]|uniref:ABC-2 transporter permease n=1 Tax=Bifidobacterium pseudolongum TaxID=1694 RepID=UPI0010202E56|nr:ABC-2 transporter permease [Bifidobacterium pseudolongum]RYQ17264.1 ABC-2 family transporter protein [Bifidobacterium pseudolongum subsp. globosum]
MKGLMARDMIAMGKNRVFLVVMLALCLFYTFSDMYVTGVMLMPMMFSTVCGNMVRNDLSAPIRRTLFTLPFSRREYAGEKYLVSIVPACVLAVMLQMASAVVHRQSITQSGMIAACAVLLTVLTVSVELPVTIIFRDRVQIARVCILAVALVAIAVSLDMGTDGLFAIITSAPAWALYGIGALLGAVALAVSVMVSLRALRTAQL